jgi:hypothetical protein
MERVVGAEAKQGVQSLKELTPLRVERANILPWLSSKTELQQPASLKQ